MQKIQATKTHCKYCFGVLLSKLQGKQIPPFPSHEDDPEVPVFVTWKKNGDLRGCIGTFAPGKLSKVLTEYAITASMKDPRFPPVNGEEVKQLSVAVSLLVNFEQKQNPYDWEVGKHGIVMKAEHNGRNYSGTFLPEVALEQKWSKQETLAFLVRKAGYYGDFANIEDRIKLTTYESSKAHLSYQQYQKIAEKS